MVSIDVRDKNDNPPRFTRLFSVNVTENAEIGSFVIQVTSSDRDIGENANATYSFTENPGQKFAIDPVTGNVTVEGAVDMASYTQNNPSSTNRPTECHRPRTNTSSR